MFGGMPYVMPQAAPVITGTKASIFSKINLSSILSNTQKTLSVVNQAIPLYYQVKPIFKNLKTLRQLGREFKNISNNEKVKNPSPNNNSNNETIIKENNNVPNPSFFI